jgi:hypothetical protein
MNLHRAEDALASSATDPDLRYAHLSALTLR